MYNPVVHHRRSIRLKGYDYSQPGLYFITICVQRRACLFGQIRDRKMYLNDAGRMVEQWYLKLEETFSDIRCSEHIVMPNHFHCIVHNVGANTQVRPTPQTAGDVENEVGWGEHIGSPLRRVVQWFKTMTTNEYIRNVKTFGWPRFEGKLWQRNYWEHIIRNETSHQRIADYIINNPGCWDTDSINPVNEKRNGKGITVGTLKIPDL